MDWQTTLPPAGRQSPDPPPAVHFQPPTVARAHERSLRGERGASCPSPFARHFEHIIITPARLRRSHPLTEPKEPTYTSGTWAVYRGVVTPGLPDGGPAAPTRARDAMSLVQLGAGGEECFPKAAQVASGGFSAVASAGFSPSELPFWNSSFASRKLRASRGSRAAPNNNTTTSTSSKISGAPILPNIPSSLSGTTIPLGIPLLVWRHPLVLERPIR